MSDPFVVIGGDAAGLSAASKCKREAPDREVIVFEKGRWVSYAHCGEPYFVKGEVEKLENLLSLTPEDVAERDIDLRREHEVTAVDPDAETVTVEGPDGEVDQPYGDLLVATGARAVTGPIEGTDLDGAFPLHGLDDAAAIRAFLLDPSEDALADVGGQDFVDRERVERFGAMMPPETAAIVGGGYVGVEMAEALSAHGLDVHVFQRSGHLISPFGEAVGEAVAEELREQGVTLHLGEEVDRLAGDGRVERLECAGGTALDVDLAVVGVGVAPNTGLLEGTGIELGEDGAVAVDEYGETARDGIYAAGDCAEDDHTVTGEPAWVPLGLTANRAGRAVGATVAGDPTPVGEVAGTAVVKAFEQECGRVGLLEDGAEDAGFDPVTETITAGSRSGYYPGAVETTVTLVADRDSERLLGGTIVGTDRAAVRIDTVATALEADMTVGELERTDLAYAPPFSPVWDPILVAAKVLNGKLKD
ncbi:pyridine nucleotide-disulfide oxidoreductase [Halorientalis sp. IM1011]|uniref:FAD-dependent oxidoreductase n=1 Tax=Halorientalis sp. IM1011 TaxID=1932360 RepID=UPI00097CCF8B|nr:FAD-dependent oxidoreductase [Halorientalis sp. IM1011]AQL43077.1 pyridine nucleotide-disulfide oxidoreductase [Halorientalis sp. IM1011]